MQNDLFDLGADLATPGFESDAEATRPPLRVVAAQVERLEREIDAMNADLAPLRSFVLPGGSALAAHLHLAPHRLPARRARGGDARRGRAASTPRRCATSTGSRTGSSSRRGSPTIGGKGDILWVPGANR